MSLRALVPAVRGTGGERRSAAWQQVLLPRRLVSCRASGRPPKRVQSPSFLQWDRAELDEDGGSRLTTDEEAARDTGGDTDADWEVSTPRDSADFSRPWGDWGASYFDSAELAGADRVRGGAEPPFGDNDDDSAAFRGAPDGPDVTPLDRQELEDILSVSATGSQYAYYWGSFDTALQRVFASLFCGLVTANVAPIVAVPTGLYFLWAPVALAARRNAPLRRYAHAGIWHARVLRAEARKSGAPGGMVFDAMGDAFLPRKRATAVRAPLPCQLCCHALRLTHDWLAASRSCACSSGTTAALACCWRCPWRQSWGTSRHAWRTSCMPFASPAYKRCSSPTCTGGRRG